MVGERERREGQEGRREVRKDRNVGSSVQACIPNTIHQICSTGKVS